MTDTEPNRSQRSETAVRWFLLSLLEPADRRFVLEHELAFGAAEIDRLGHIADRLDTLPGTQPFRATVDLGLRINAVMREWLLEQLAALEVPEQT
jgi:hypothetical protein